MTFSFQFASPCFLIALSRTLSTTLNKYSEYEYSYLVSDFSVIASGFSPFNLMIAIDLVYITFTMFVYVPCIPNNSKTFKVKKGCWNLSKDFQHLMRWSEYLFYSVCLYGRVHWWMFVCWISVHSWDEDYLIRINYSFHMDFDLICKHCVEYFCIDIYKGNYSVILFLRWVFILLRNQGNYWFNKWIWQYSFCFSCVW